MELRRQLDSTNISVPHLKYNGTRGTFGLFFKLYATLIVTLKYSVDPRHNEIILKFKYIIQNILKSLKNYL